MKNMKWIALGVIICITAIASVSLINANTQPKDQSVITEGTGSTQATPEAKNERETEEKTKPKPTASPEQDNDEIYINELPEQADILGSSGYYIDVDDFHEITKEEIFAYYGIEFDISDVIEGLIENHPESFGIFINGESEIYEPIGNFFTWENKKTRESVSFEVNKGHLSIESIRIVIDYWGKMVQLSTINGTEMLLTHYYDYKFNDDVYYADFMYKDLGFNLYLKNVDKKNFIRVLRYMSSR